MVNDDIIDRQVFAELQGSAGADFVAEVVDSFVVDAPQHLAQLQRCGAAGEATAFRRAAHSLKSNGNTFGALALAGLARELELADLAATGDRLPPMLAALAAEFERTAAALRSLRDG